MQWAEKHTVAITTAVGGAATAYTKRKVTGQVHTIIYTKDDFAAGVDFTITTETTLQGLWTELDVNASAIRAPQQPTHTQAGVADTDPGNRPIIAVEERIKIVIAQGGDAKNGTFDIIIA